MPYRQPYELGSREAVPSVRPGYTASLWPQLRAAIGLFCICTVTLLPIRHDFRNSLVNRQMTSIHYVAASSFSVFPTLRECAIGSLCEARVQTPIPRRQHTPILICPNNSSSQPRHVGSQPPGRLEGYSDIQTDMSKCLLFTSSNVAHHIFKGVAPLKNEGADSSFNT